MSGGSDGTTDERKSIYLVDGFNLLHAVVIRGRDRKRWWSADHQERVIRLVERFPCEAWVVFDAAKPDSERYSGSTTVPVYFEASADDCLVEMAKRLEPDKQVHLVSADRALQDRARRYGAIRCSPWAFSEACTPEG